VFGRPFFRADSIVLGYSDLEAGKQRWIRAFDCKVANTAHDRDNPLPSDVALRLPGSDEPAILLCSKTEIELAHLDAGTPLASDIFCDKLRKAHELLSSRGVNPGAIQDGGDMQFFEVRDPEGNLIQICKEP